MSTLLDFLASQPPENLRPGARLEVVAPDGRSWVLILGERTPAPDVDHDDSFNISESWAFGWIPDDVTPPANAETPPAAE